MSDSIERISPSRASEILHELEIPHDEIDTATYNRESGRLSVSAVQILPNHRVRLEVSMEHQLGDGE